MWESLPKLKSSFANFVNLHCLFQSQRFISISEYREFDKQDGRDWTIVRTRSVFIEEDACKMITEEEQHLGEVNKMLRKPGEIARFKAV